MSWNFTTKEQLEAAGYEYVNEARCSGPTCDAIIQWWRTPNGRAMPIDGVTFAPHFSTCPDKDRFKKS